eukprot:299975_1
MSVYFVIGRNLSGELGVGHCCNISKLTKISNTQNINKLYCGSNFIIYSDSNGNYYSAGDNTYGQCAINDITDQINELKLIQYFQKKNIRVQKVFVSSECAFWIDTEFNVYGCGSNQNQQINNIAYTRAIYEPDLIAELSNKRIKQIKSTMEYSIALHGLNLLEINILITGFGRSCAVIPKEIIQIISHYFGLNDLKVCATPNITYKFDSNVDKIRIHWREIKLFQDKQIVNVETGYSFALFLAQCGSVWSVGRAGSVCLGHGEIGYTKQPIKEIAYFMQNNIKITHIECGWYHVLAINDNYNVFSWGSSKNGECGHKELKNYLIPKPIEFFDGDKVTNIKCGVYHSTVCMNNQDWFLFGLNVYNECIKEDEEKVNIPYHINDIVCDKATFNIECIVDICLGFCSTIIIGT